MATPLVGRPTFEHHHDGLGIGYARPRISWQFLASDDTIPDWKQSSYDLEVTWAARPEPEVFHVASDSSILVPWPAAPLTSRGRASVRVRSHGTGTEVQGGCQGTTGWSEPASVECGLLRRGDWTASFVTSSTRIGPDGPLRPLRFRREFHLGREMGSGLSRGRLYITGLGVYKAYVNGRPTSDEEMAPGWTDYNFRLNYRVHDVTSLLRCPGPNVIAVEAAEGWYAGRLGFRQGTRFNYGGRELAVLAQLEIAQAGNPRPWTLASDESWSVGPSALTFSDIYDGEVVDQRLEQEGWQRPGFEAGGGWVPARQVPWPRCELVAPDAPPVRITERLAAVNVFRSRGGKVIVDFGQNLVGRVQVGLVDMPAGREITLRHAEVLEHGELGTRPLRLAKAADTLISSGDKVESWTPRYTFHGFRYVQVDGWPGSEGVLPARENFTALVMHTDLRRRGRFTCSNQLVNRLHENITWSMRGNFLSIPTDCPQRNERLGWTGDIQVFCPTASFLYDTVGFLGDWLQDLAAEQLQEGRGCIPPLICPQIPTPGWPHMPSAVWDDAVVLTPHALYESSGDSALLERQFRSMRGWLDEGVRRDVDGLWDPDLWQLGDWLDPRAPPDDPANGVSDNVLIADAYLVHVTGLFASTCRVLGRMAEFETYDQQARDLRRAFHHKYITPAGYLASNSQAAIALVLRFSLYRDAENAEVLGARLDKLVRRAGFRIATGFAGTPAILFALSGVRRSQLAYRMLLEKTCPSWLYPVTMGATTVWERWDSMLPDGSLNPGTMTSFNHYALGAVADWLHATVGGISQLQPGWRVVRVRPVPGGTITSAAVSFDGPSGVVSCSWRWLRGEEFEMELVVPPNSTAHVTLPSELRAVADADEDEPYRVVGSGLHHFRCPYRAGEWPPKPIVAPHRIAPAEQIA